MLLSQAQTITTEQPRSLPRLVVKNLGRKPARIERMVQRVCGVRNNVFTTSTFGVDVAPNFKLKYLSSHVLCLDTRTSPTCLHQPTASPIISSILVS